MSNTARTDNKRTAQKPIEENRAEGNLMEEHAANLHPKVSSEDEVHSPRANYPLVRVIEQGRSRNHGDATHGECRLTYFPSRRSHCPAFTGLIDEYADLGGWSAWIRRSPRSGAA